MKAVFIVGSGRSGTTIIYDRLTSVIDAATVPALGGRYPFLLSPALIANRLGLKKWIFRPSSESLALLASCGLSAERSHSIGRAFSEDDISLSEKTRLQCYLAKLALLSGRDLAVIKNTGNSMRIAAINSAVEQCHFVYVIRDPRAVVNSLLNVRFWPDMTLWWCGDTPDQRQAAGEAPEVTAARHWLHQVNAAETGLRSLPVERVHRVYYEQFATDPVSVLSGLSKTIGCDANTDASKLTGVVSGRTEGWKSKLTPNQIDNIESVVSDRLTEYGYKRFNC